MSESEESLKRISKYLQGDLNEAEGAWFLDKNALRLAKEALANSEEKSAAVIQDLVDGIATERAARNAALVEATKLELALSLFVKGDARALVDEVSQLRAQLAAVMKERDDVMGVTEKFKHERDEARAEETALRALWKNANTAAHEERARAEKAEASCAALTKVLASLLQSNEYDEEDSEIRLRRLASVRALLAAPNPGEGWVSPEAHAAEVNRANGFAEAARQLTQDVSKLKAFVAEIEASQS